MLTARESAFFSKREVCRPQIFQVHSLKGIMNLKSVSSMVWLWQSPQTRNVWNAFHASGTNHQRPPVVLRETLKPV